jgi:hypothetical protein
LSNYTKSTNFATKDNLTPGDPLKIVRGTEIDTEFNNIATAIATKTDNASAAITGGTINDTTIGATTASTGAFTTLAASGNVTLSGGTANGVAYLNGSKVVTSGSALVFDGTNLGIGTSSPAAKLEVRGADAAARFRGSNIQYLDVIATSGGAVRLDANNGNAFVFAQNTTEQMRLDTSGNLGLGVTPSAWASGTAFQVLTASVSSVGNSAQYMQNAYYNAGYKYIGSGYASLYEQNKFNGTHNWFNAPSGTAGNAISFTQAMTLDASGNLGIGTSSPATKLQVNGGYISATDGTRTGYFGSDGTGILLGSTTNHYLRFITNDTERARIDSSGNLIQTVNTTAATLTTNQTLTFSIVDNSTLRISVRGSDGTTRTATIALT